MALALSLSVGLHIAVTLAETIAERYKWNVESFDHVVSWPAWIWSDIVPTGHGVLQLMFPLVFSLAFYAAAFWLIVVFYERLRNWAAGGKQVGK